MTTTTIIRLPARGEARPVTRAVRWRDRTCEDCGRPFRERVGVRGRERLYCVGCAPQGYTVDAYADIMAAAVALREILLVGPA